MTKLRVQVLPCVLAFVDGVCVDRIIGFEGLGRSADTFATSDLETRLVRSGVLVRAKMSGSGDGWRDGGERGGRNRKEEEDDDDDWD